MLNLRVYGCGLLVGWFFLITGCASYQKDVTDIPLLPLLEPTAMMSGILRQKVSLEVKGTKRDFLLVSRQSSEKIIAVVLLPSGQQLMQLEFGPEGFRQTAKLSAEVPGRELLAIMQFSNWPETVVKREYLATDGWQIELNQHNRRLNWQQVPVLDVKRTSKSLIVMNYLEDYRVVITDLGSST